VDNVKNLYCRVTTYLENLEIREKSGNQKLVREKSGNWEKVEKLGFHKL